MRQETSMSLGGGSATASLPCDLTAAPKSGQQQLLAVVTGEGGSRTHWKETILVVFTNRPSKPYISPGNIL